MVSIEAVKRVYGEIEDGYVLCRRCPVRHGGNCRWNGIEECDGYELAWKIIQKYLNEKEGITIES